MTGCLISLETLNSCLPDDFVAVLGQVFEHSPWVAEAAIRNRPFPTVAALHEAMAHAVRTAPRERQSALLAGHPELGSRVKRRDWTGHSQAEQGGLGLDRLSAEEFDRFAQINAAYRTKFGFPFIICVRRHTRDSVLAQFARRLDNTIEREREQAFVEIGLITRLRVVSLVDGPGKPMTSGRLSTHVLDIAAGRPACGVRVALHEIGASARSLLKETVTNADGRTDAPLIADEPLRIGTYELTFQVGDYFSRSGFCDAVPVRFSIAEPERHYHVPLLVTPWSYTTYCGS
jgi:2-oxo-4-hydroxy-4-carboxy-5-ureidoimidazoline decarboxylase